MKYEHLIEDCIPPYIDAETLRIKAEETWPQWKINFYNENIATTAHARKLHSTKDIAIEINEIIDELVKVGLINPASPEEI